MQIYVLMLIIQPLHIQKDIKCYKAYTEICIIALILFLSNYKRRRQLPTDILEGHWYSAPTLHLQLTHQNWYAGPTHCSFLDNLFFSYGRRDGGEWLGIYDIVFMLESSKSAFRPVRSPVKFFVYNNYIINNKSDKSRIWNLWLTVA
jgi:hypothetical protein